MVGDCQYLYTIFIYNIYIKQEKPKVVMVGVLTDLQQMKDKGLSHIPDY